MKQVFITTILLLSATLSSPAGEKDDILQRIRQRLPDIVDLKIEKLIMESQDGFLRPVNSTKALPGSAAREVLDENNDRERLFVLILQTHQPELRDPKKSAEAKKLAREKLGPVFYRLKKRKGIN